MTSTIISLFAALTASTTPAVAPQAAPPGLAPTTPAYAQRVAPAVVAILTRIPLDRPSVLTLGPVRSGSGVIVDPTGYVITVGYILTDAASIQVTLRDGRVVPGHFIGQDVESGIGVLKLEGPGPWPYAPLGNSTTVAVGDPVAIIGTDAENALSISQGAVQEIRRFTGYWEYLLERSFIVGPPNPAFGGSPLVNTQGEVIGVTSLRLGEPTQVNLAIPIEYYQAVREELLREGRVKSRPPRPWLGLYTVETPQGLIVAGASPSGPALEAGFARGDIIARLNGEKIEGQEDFYRKLWKTAIGQELTILVLRDGKFEIVKVKPIDRRQTLRPSN